MKNKALAALFVIILVAMAAIMVAAFSNSNGNNDDDGIPYEDEYITIISDNEGGRDKLILKAKDGNDHNWYLKWYVSGKLENEEPYYGVDIQMSFIEGSSFIVSFYPDSGKDHVEYTIDPNAKTVTSKYVG